MREDAQKHLPLLSGFEASTQRATEPAFVATECALGLPALAVTTEILLSTHLSSELREWQASSSVRNVSGWDDGRPNAEFLAAEHVVSFRVVGLVGEHAANALVPKTFLTAGSN